VRNKKLSKVTLNIESEFALGTTVYADAQGEAYFVYEIKQFAETDTTFATPLKTWVRTITGEGNTYTAPNLNPLTGLDVGYRYTVTELQTMRYNVTATKIKDLGSSDIDGTASSVTIDLTGTPVLATPSGTPLESQITVTFTNTKTKNQYLSDTVLRTNKFTVS
jgi:hypothetical protein